MLDDLRSALHRLDRQPKDTVKKPTKAFSGEVATGSRAENASQTDTHASRQPNCKSN
jgi:ribonuclease P protein component